MANQLLMLTDAIETLAEVVEGELRNSRRVRGGVKKVRDILGKVKRSVLGEMSRGATEAPEAPPVEETPADTPPVDEPPAPVEGESVTEETTEDPLKDAPPAEETPAEVPPAEKPKVDKAGKDSKKPKGKK